MNTTTNRTTVVQAYRKLSMSYWVAMLFFLSFIGFFSFIYLIRTLRPTYQNGSSSFPPGPPSLPVIGHLHMMGDLPYRTLREWAQKFGPIMQLRFGLVRTIVVSSSETAELFLKTHDLSFSNRPKNQVSERISHRTMVFTDYGPFLLNIRKMCSLHLLKVSRIESFRLLREQEAMEFIATLKKAANRREIVNIGEVVRLMIENITCRMSFGAAGHKERLTVKPLIEECLSLANAFNINDFLPFMKAFDFQALARRAEDVIQKLDGFMEKMIAELEQDDISQPEHHRNFTSVMMSLMKSYKSQADEFSRSSIKVVALDLLGGGWDTAATTIEWALKELLKHPRVMKKVQEELESVVGTKRMVEEGDYSKLTYLDMVVKEVMRLHPFVPLIPRESAKDVTVRGHHIPEKTSVIINVWAIGRDPNVWPDNAEEFYPERFANIKLDVRGHNHQLLPFGSGRRKCPGLELGLRTVQFALAQLLHCFALKLPDGMSSGDVDMTERFHAKSNPLFVIPTFRLYI